MQRVGMRLPVAGVVVVAGLLVACGGGVDTYPVTGKVSFADGTPLTKGTVIFSSGQYSAKGPIQADGTYSLTSYKAGDGAALGKHTVYIIGAEEGAYPDPPKPLIDSKFTLPKTSGLQCEVKSGGNTFDIQVTKPAG